VIDNPSAVDWFERALDVGWTRDPFDRLLVAHARLRRWRLATADATILEHLAPHEYIEL
jgi:PIN domain nuclease of toxin-antitoxin system